MVDIEKKIEAAAKQCFLEKSYLGTSVRDIAKAADVNVAMVNYYFRSKEKLFERIFSEQFNLMIIGSIENVSQSSDLFEKIRLIINNIIENLNKNPHLPSFVISEINRDPQRFFKAFNFENVREALKIFFQQVDDEIKKGNIQNIDPFQLFIHIISLCIFPFLAQPIVSYALEMDVNAFSKIQETRKNEVYELIIRRLKK